MTAVIVIGVWVLAVALALRTNHRLNSIPTPPPTPPAPVDESPEIPEWASGYWTQARVDAQFRAMTAPLSR